LNGFVKIPLQNGASPDGAFRLHVWKDSHPDSDVHNHRWDFISLPILGSFLERRYELAEGTDGQLLECRPRRSDGIIAVRPVRKAKAVLTDESERMAGQPYECNSRVLHAIDPTRNRLAATLISCGPALETSALVHKAPESPDIGIPMHAFTPSLTPGQLADILNTVAANL
jgi:hypothetical protein